MFNGDRTKWLKLAYGMMAINLNHYSNKSTYKPAEVIANVDKSFASNADDALFTYPNTSRKRRPQFPRTDTQQLHGVSPDELRP